ncbi:autotransporter domain-containing protein [Ruegeria sp. R13_0]|uniref:autotransporter domain-containing protein n=1 Tax=Ruegeria sp. R13_0 TaxID=2821099 RepID=UPI001ADD4D7B|nr:autotransporter domain-containing protein [Ruegeria sp. R13_0]MBO9436382.1 autotransporter domain-containing protein [Ruegeria sp. R13_0]
MKLISGNRLLDRRWVFGKSALWQVLTLMITLSVPAIAQPTSDHDPIPSIFTYRWWHIDHSLSAQPDLSDLLSANPIGYLDANITNEVGDFDFATGGRQATWARFHGGWFEDEQHLRAYFFGAAGVHFRLTPNAIAGVMFQFDQMTYESYGFGSKGKGYLVGPYFVAKNRDHPLYLEIQYLIGRTETDFIGFRGAVEDIVSEQTLATVKVSGELIYDDFKLMPHLLISRIENSRQPYVDYATGSIAEQSMTVTDVVVGVDYSNDLPVESASLVLTSGISANWSETVAKRSGLTLAEDFGGVWGKVHIGATYTKQRDFAFRARATLTGIVTESEQDWGLNIGLEMTF